MKTNQIMKSPDRRIGNIVINQRTKDGFFDATGFLKSYNEMQPEGRRKKLHNYMQSKQTIELIAEVTKDLSCLQPVRTTRGNGSRTWVQAIVFIDLVMWLSPKFKVKALQFLNDNLIQLRHAVGDFYKEQSAELSKYLSRQGRIVRVLDFKKEANSVNEIIFGRSEVSRNQLSTKQLEKLDTIQKINIKLLKQDVPNKARYLKLKEYASVLFD